MREVMYRVFFTFLILFSSPMMAVEAYPPLSENEQEQYNQKIVTEAKKAEDKAKSLTEQLLKNPNPASDSTMNAYKNAVEMAVVKSTLVSNFLNQPALNSPLVRDKLLKILQQETITESDLQALQDLVSQENLKTK